VSVQLKADIRSSFVELSYSSAILHFQVERDLTLRNRRRRGNTPPAPSKIRWKSTRPMPTCPQVNSSPDQLCPKSRRCPRPLVSWGGGYALPISHPTRRLGTRHWALSVPRCQWPTRADPTQPSITPGSV